jgi:purine catabolism regulator
MPLTVAQAIQELPVLASAQVIAGHGGLSRVIRWTHIVDHPDVIPWVREGNLLLTTAFALKDSPQSQSELIPILADKGLAGMIVSIGRYIRQVPSVMVEAAERLDFPIITLPWEVPLVEVTHAIHERILSEQYALNEQAFHIHKMLTQLVLEGGGLEALAQTLASLLNRSVTIEDSNMRLLAHASVEIVDEVRERSIAEGRTPSEVIRYLHSLGLFEKLKEEPKPHSVPPAAHLGMSLERIIAPIMVGSQLYGYIWIIATDRALTDLDFVAIERGAHVAALILSREEAIYQAEQRIKVEWLESLMDPLETRSLYDLSEILRHLGLQNGYHVLILEANPGNAMDLRWLKGKIETIAQEKSLEATVIELAGRFVLLLGSADALRVSEFAEEVVERSAAEGFVITIGLSSPATQAKRVRQSYQEALDALRVGLTLTEGKGGIWAYDRLGFLNCLLTLPEEVRANNRYCAIVESIWAHDQRSGNELLKTLEVYLDHRSNAQRAAQQLYIHRNTLRQRLAKIRERWDLDLDEPYTAMNLQIAIKDWRLRGHP